MLKGMLSGARPDDATFKKATNWVRAQMSKRRDPHAHPSHLAAEVLAEADEKFKLDSFGVEGWATSTQSGVQYLNFGDTYSPTIVVRCTRSGCRVSYAAGGWGPYAGG